MNRPYATCYLPRLTAYSKSHQRAAQKYGKTHRMSAVRATTCHHPSKIIEGQYANCRRVSVSVYQFSAGELCWHWRFSLFYPFSVRCLETQPRPLENIRPEYENVSVCLVLRFQEGEAGCWCGSKGHFLGCESESVISAGTKKFLGLAKVLHVRIDKHCNANGWKNWRKS